MKRASGERQFVRWNGHHRAQHLGVVLSFTALVFTGLPLRYPEAAPSRWIMSLLGGATNAGIIHRVAAVGLLAASAYHVLYVLAMWRAGHRQIHMLPGLKDVRDVFDMLRYFAGLQPHPPKMGRYGFPEKFEYWAMVWGTAIMAATGFMMWFPEVFLRYLPAWALAAAQAIHGWEAVLAALAILIWHFYHAHWSPDVFPMSRVWLTGRISESELKHHHALEWERIQAEEVAAGPAAD